MSKVTDHESIRRTESVRTAVRAMIDAVILLQQATEVDPVKFRRLNEFAYEAGDSLIHASAVLTAELAERASVEAIHESLEFWRSQQTSGGVR